jgi:hypothetical protein
MKKRKYMAGGDIDEAGLGQYEKKVRKPLPSETIKENTKAKETNEKVKGAIIGGVTGIPGMAISAGKRVYENVMGTPEQNRKAAEEMKDYGPEKKFQSMKRAVMGKDEEGKKAGGKISAYKSGGSVSSASKRADGCAVKGKTRGRMV